jgi:exopolysaccharide biosynthesis predicted pyruvyltransferase EpsI
VAQRLRVERSRARLLRAIGTPRDLTLIRYPGNVGDQLIHAGTRQLLASFPYREIEVSAVKKREGDTALVSGGGAWCGAFHTLPSHMPTIEERFRRVIVLPSSFDTRLNTVRQILAQTHATVFAREATSYQMIHELCRAEIACDCAFYFDFRPYRQQGSGVLTAFRTDQESAFRSVPPGNVDISATCDSLDEWLQTIARHELVRTDRAHVLIAAALLGKRVEYLASSYHKVPAIVDYALDGYPVSRLPDDWAASMQAEGSRPTDTERLRRLTGAAASLIPQGSAFLLVDDSAIGTFPLAGRKPLPFIERDGIYWGPPGDDSQAIGELERMRGAGATFLVIAWPAFWWLDYYADFHRYLRAGFRCVLDDDTAKIFDLRTPAQEPNTASA